MMEVAEEVRKMLSNEYRNFELFDAATNTVRAKAGKYEVYYGSSSADKDLNFSAMRLTEFVK